ncbi:MAG: OmpH family outer membrane protein [Betaproteobacteria bacterium]|jgi:outer membrane protein|nr:OmpH family outer membrane protein [Betaproteobacteria bacterium]
MKLKTLQIFMFLAMLAVASASTAQTTSKIGFVSLDRILRDAAPAQRAQKKIEAEFSKRDQEMQRAAEQLKQMQEALERNAVTMSDSERQRREREFAESTRDFQRKQREFREDLNQRRNEELASVLERANRAVRQIAEQEKYDIIFQEAVYANPKIDITDKVIKALDDSRSAK